MRELKQRFVNQGVEGLRQQRRLQFLEEKVGHRLFYTYLLKSFTISLIKNHYSLYQNSKRHF